MTYPVASADRPRSNAMDAKASKRSMPVNAKTALTILLFFAVLDTASLQAAETYSGEAHSRDGTLLYVERHLLYREHDADARLVMYDCPDGKPFARKHVSYGAGKQAPDFALEDARDGYAEGVRDKDGARLLFVRDKAAAAERTAPFTAGADSVVDAGFDNFVRAHWDGLKIGSSLPLSFVVPSKLTSLDFKVTAVGDEKNAGREARRFRLSLARWYGGVLPHIDVIYDAHSHELLGYEGVGNIRGADGRNLDVRISFPEQRRGGQVSDADVATAAAAALNGSCKL